MRVKQNRVKSQKCDVTIRDGTNQERIRNVAKLHLDRHKTGTNQAQRTNWERIRNITFWLNNGLVKLPPPIGIKRPLRGDYRLFKQVLRGNYVTYIYIYIPSDGKCDINTTHILIDFLS